MLLLKYKITVTNVIYNIINYNSKIFESSNL